VYHPPNFFRLIPVLALLGLLWLTVAPARAGDAPRPFTGSVVETMNSGGYTYLLVDDGQAKLWIATTPVALKVGSKVETPFGLTMKKFYSPSLKRTFDEILFVDSIIVDGQKQNSTVSRAGERSSAPAPAAPPASFGGQIIEVLDGGKYAFLHVQGFHKAVWVATKPGSAKVGDLVSVPRGEVMFDFHSTTLNRTFDEIQFVERVTVNNAPEIKTMSSQTALPPGHPQIASQHQQAPPAKLAEPIKQPAGGKSIAEIFAQRKTLAGQEVTVKGQVTKFSANILKRNWLHLADGTGAPGGNDLTVTTADTAAVGDTVTIRGKLVLDQDFGFGYAYPLLIEKAAVQK